VQELDSYDIRSIDSELGRTLQELQILVRRKQFLETLGSDNKEAVEALRFRDMKVEDLCLDFTLPGYPDYVLKSGGSDEMVCSNFLLTLRAFRGCWPRGQGGRLGQY
jgi:E3 ubiquitin-protein ligase TRIP12